MQLGLELSVRASLPQISHVCIATLYRSNSTNATSFQGLQCAIVRVSQWMYMSARRCKKRWLYYKWTVLRRTSVIRLCSPRYLHCCHFLRTRSSGIRVVGAFLYYSCTLRCFDCFIIPSRLLQRCTVYHHSDSLLIRVLLPCPSPCFGLSFPGCYLIGFVLAVDAKYAWLQLFNHRDVPLVEISLLPPSRKHAPACAAILQFPRTHQIFVACVLNLLALRIVLFSMLWLSSPLSRSIWCHGSVPLQNERKGLPSPTVIPLSNPLFMVSQILASHSLIWPTVLWFATSSFHALFWLPFKHSALRFRCRWFLSLFTGSFLFNPNTWLSNPSVSVLRSYCLFVILPRPLLVWLCYALPSSSPGWLCACDFVFRYIDSCFLCSRVSALPALLIKYNL